MTETLKPNKPRLRNAPPEYEGCIVLQHKSYYKGQHLKDKVLVKLEFPDGKRDWVELPKADFDSWRV